MLLSSWRTLKRADRNCPDIHVDKERYIWKVVGLPKNLVIQIKWSEDILSFTV